MLAVAVGSVVGIFDVANQALHGELPYRQPESIVVANNNGSRFLVSLYDRRPNPLALTVFERLAEYHLETADLDSESGPQRLLIACVTPQFFSVLGVRMALGSDLPNTPAPSPGHALPWLPIILNHDMWRTYFGADRGIVGRAITFKFLPPYHFQVIGVAPPGVRLPSGVDAWIPEHLVSSTLIQGAAPPNWSEATIGRLRPGITAAAAEVAIRSWPRSDSLWIWYDTAHLISLREFLVGKLYNLGPLLWLVTFFFLLLTITAAVSIFGLDFNERRDEFRMRKILGATPGRLFQCLNVETATILIFALAISFFVRFAITRATVGYLQLPFIFQTSGTWIDLVMAVGTIGAVAVEIALVQGLGLGIFRFFDKFRSKPIYGESKLRAVSRFRFPLQLVPAAMILAMAILLVRSAYGVMCMDPGVQPRGAFVSEVALAIEEAEYMFSGINGNAPAEEVNPQFSARADQFGREMNFDFSLILQQILGHAGVTEAGVITISPYSGYPAGGTEVYVSRTQERPLHSELVPAHLVSISPGAIPALGMKMIYGRNFRDGVNDSTDRDTTIINEDMAKRIGPGATSLGQYVIPQVSGFIPNRPTRIIGIVQNVHETDLFAPTQPTIYLPFRQYALSDVDIVFRARRNMPFQEADSLIRSSVRSVDPGATVPRFESLEVMVQSAGVLTRYCAYFLLAFAMLGIFMTGICAWARSIGDVRRREHEIGIRLAVGAKPGQVIRLIVGSQVMSSLLAASIGVVVAWWFSRLVEYLFNGVNASEIRNYLFSIAAITSYVLVISVWAARGTVRRNVADLVGKRTF
jgi:hypothetical protein